MLSLTLPTTPCLLARSVLACCNKDGYTNNDDIHSVLANLNVGACKLTYHTFDEVPVGKDNFGRIATFKAVW